MTLTDLTALAGGVAALLTSGGALYASSRARQRTLQADTLLSWEGLAKEHREDRESLRAELRASEEDCKRKLRDMERTHLLQINDAHKKIASLENQVAALMRKLYLPPSA